MPKKHTKATKIAKTFDETVAHLRAIGFFYPDEKLELVAISEPPKRVKLSKPRIKVK